MIAILGYVMAAVGLIEGDDPEGGKHRPEHVLPNYQRSTPRRPRGQRRKKRR